MGFRTRGGVLCHDWHMAKLGRRATYEERLRACQLIESGKSPDLVAEILGFGRATVFEWLREYRTLGPGGLRTKKTRGPATKLTDAQLARLYALIVGTDPRQLSFRFALWTRAMVAELIRREFKVKPSPVSVGRALARLGMSPRRPLYRAYQQNPAAVAEWKQQTFPAIASEAKRLGAVVFFADEAAVRTDYHAGTGVDPVWWTPDLWGTLVPGRSPLCRTTIRRNSVGRWWSWCARDGRRRSSPRSSSPPPSRSVPGCARPTLMTVAVPMA